MAAPPPKPPARTDQQHPSPDTPAPPQQKKEITALRPGDIVRPIRTHEIQQTLPLFFLPLHDHADKTLRQAVHAFRQLARQQHYDLSQQIVALRHDRIVAACLCIPQKGRYAFALTSTAPAPTPTDPDLAYLTVETIRQSTARAFKHNACFVQILLETDDKDRRDICCRAGFQPLTNLIYMMRIPSQNTPSQKPQPHLAWRAYQPQHHQLFKDVIKQTYLQSLDCPELENLRDMEDVITAHRASGQFDPALWQLLLYRKQPAGVLLLTPQNAHHSLDVTYMGLCPQFRKKGLSSLLMQHAIDLAAQLQYQALTLAVDQRNTPARKLYQRLNFREFLRRTALLARPKP